MNMIFFIHLKLEIASAISALNDMSEKHRLTPQEDKG